jgi:hypothetical protein
LEEREGKRRTDDGKVIPLGLLQDQLTDGLGRDVLLLLAGVGEGHGRGDDEVGGGKGDKAAVRDGWAGKESNSVFRECQSYLDGPSCW